ncbi:hypothetical protein ACFQFQ_16805 [Sulfitobacter porphyrae]|uniref:SnoaL-like domain-containing protein n=1 Tax=Sulfitobacter porphyrae TaxID=1246864 RepID=A0ABW2B6G8_9RHOB
MMTRIQGSKDCGNSPKNRFVQDVAIALETGDATPEKFADDVIWERATETSLEGKKSLLKSLAARDTPETVIIEHAISHGKVGAASGETTLNGAARRFCHVIEFASVKGDLVAVIKSYA